MLNLCHPANGDVPSMSSLQSALFPPAGIVAALLMTLFTLAPLPAVSQETFDGQQLMDATGLDRVFETYGRDISFSVRQQPVSPGEPFIKAWEETAARVYDADEMHESLRESLTGVFTPTEQMALRDFYLSDFGKKIVTLEAASLGLEPERQAVIEREGTALWEDLSPERKDLLLRIQSLAGGDAVPVMLRETMRALYLGMMLASPNQPGALDTDTIDAMVDQLLPGLVAEVEAATRALSAVIYEDMEDGELEAYAAFLETPAARSFYSAVLIAMTGVTVQATETFGAQLARRLTQQGA